MPGVASVLAPLPPAEPYSPHCSREETGCTSTEVPQLPEATTPLCALESLSSQTSFRTYVQCNVFSAHLYLEPGFLPCHQRHCGQSKSCTQLWRLDGGSTSPERSRWAFLQPAGGKPLAQKMPFNVHFVDHFTVRELRPRSSVRTQVAVTGAVEGWGETCAGVVPNGSSFTGILVMEGDTTHTEICVIASSS